MKIEVMAKEAIASRDADGIAHQDADRARERPGGAREQVHEQGPAHRPTPLLELEGVHAVALVGHRGGEEERKALAHADAVGGKRGRVEHLARVHERHARDNRRDRRAGEPHIGNHELARARVEQHGHGEHLQRIEPNGVAQDAARTPMAT